MLFDRARRAGRYLEWKVRLFTLGAVLAVVGMAMSQDWMTWVAIVVLVLGMALRFLPDRGGQSVEPEVSGSSESTHDV